MKAEYNDCTVKGCDNHKRKEFGDLCHFHKSIITHKKCANIYFKHQVEWCNVKDNRVDSLECEGCEDRLDPEENIKLCEKMWKKGL